MPQRVTQAQVARAAGVSATTVSLVLNGRKNTRISPEVASRVRAVAQQLGYSPDPTATSLRTGRSRAIGFLSDGVTVTRFASAMISGVMEAAEEHGHTVLMAEWDHDPQRLEKAAASMVERRVDGLVFGLMMARKLELPPLPEGLPVAVVNGRTPTHASVLPAEFQAGRAAVEHLLGLGHRRIAVVGRWNQPLSLHVSATIGERFDGIDAAMAEAGLAFEAEVPGVAWEPPLGYEAGRRILAEHPETTAVLCANDRVAFGVYQACAEAGARVPERFSVMSFDNEELATYLRPSLSTMRLPYREMGTLGADLVLDGIEGRTPSAADSVRVPMALLERGSTAAP